MTSLSVPAAAKTAIALYTAFSRYSAVQSAVSLLTDWDAARGLRGPDRRAPSPPSRFNQESCTHISAKTTTSPHLQYTHSLAWCWPRRCGVSEGRQLVHRWPLGISWGLNSGHFGTEAALSRSIFRFFLFFFFLHLVFLLLPLSCSCSSSCCISVCVCACARACVCTLRIVSTAKILCLLLIIIMVM